MLYSTSIEVGDNVLELESEYRGDNDWVTDPGNYNNSIITVKMNGKTACFESWGSTSHPYFNDDYSLIGIFVMICDKILDFMRMGGEISYTDAKSIPASFFIEYCDKYGLEPEAWHEAIEMISKTADDMSKLEYIESLGLREAELPEEVLREYGNQYEIDTVI